MNLDKNVVGSAVDKKYTEFSNSIKTELQNKMTNHEVSVKYSKEFDKIQHQRKIYAQVNDPTGD